MARRPRVREGEVKRAAAIQTRGSNRPARSVPGILGEEERIGADGGRQAYLAACTLPGIGAGVDCYGGGVAGPPGELTPLQPVDPLDHTKNLSCPLLGLFGKEDQRPSPAQVAKTEAEL